MRRLLLVGLSVLLLSGCSLFGAGEGAPANPSADATNSETTASAADSTPTPTPTPTPTGPQTPEEYSLFLQQRAQEIAIQISDLSTGITSFNKGTITQAELQSSSEQAFKSINEQSKLVKETPVPEGAEPQQEAWLSAAKSIQNTQDLITSCLTAKNPVCNAIVKTLQPLQSALSAVK